MAWTMPMSSTDPSDPKQDYEKRFLVSKSNPQATKEGLNAAFWVDLREFVTQYVNWHLRFPVLCILLLAVLVCSMDPLNHSIDRLTLSEHLDLRAYTFAPPRNKARLMTIIRSVSSPCRRKRSPSFLLSTSPFDRPLLLHESTEAKHPEFANGPRSTSLRRFRHTRQVFPALRIRGVCRTEIAINKVDFGSLQSSRS